MQGTGAAQQQATDEGEWHRRHRKSSRERRFEPDGDLSQRFGFGIWCSVVGDVVPGLWRIKPWLVATSAPALLHFTIWLVAFKDLVCGN